VPLRIAIFPELPVRHGEEQGRVAKLVLIGAVPPLMLKTAANPGGLPIEVFDDLRKQLAANRAQFYLDFASGPFYSFNRPGAKVSQGVIQNWWRQGMMGGANAHYLGIKAFSETDFTEDLKVITVPTLVMHGDDDQIVPIADSALLSGEAAEERRPGGLREVPARHVHDVCRRGESRPAGVHPGRGQPQRASRACGRSARRLERDGRVSLERLAERDAALERELDQSPGGVAAVGVEASLARRRCGRGLG
jgi:hypothetical protein